MSRWTRPSSLLLFAIFGSGLLAWVLGPTQAWAQEETSLQGLVADELTGEVITSARVTIVGKKLETRTDEAGTFAFPDAPTGTISVRVEADGYPVVIDEVDVASGEMLFVHIVLPQVQFVLNEILVTGTPSLRPTEIRDSAKTAADLIALQVPGASRAADPARRVESPIRLRGVNSIVLGSEPVFFLDGIRMSGTMNEVMDALRRIPSESVRRIRILRGPSAAFVQGAASGAILVETRSSPDDKR